MFIFFGTRASKLKERKIKGNTTCPHCESQNSFIATTFGKYFHVFWIPLFPLFKTTVLECSHCKKSYNQNEITGEINRALLKENEINPVKRPLWHGCGCLVIIALFLVIFLSIAIGVFSKKGETTPRKVDPRKEFLKNDINKVSSKPTFETDSISFYLKPCLNLSIDGVKTDRIKYYSKIVKNKLLVLLKVTDMKKIKKSSRKELVFAVEECLLNLNLSKAYDCYIGVDGRWNMLLIKTPLDSDLSGKYADSDLLLSFYNNEDQ